MARQGPRFDTVAVIGTGVIGRSWIQVFARAGCRVLVFDQNPDQLTGAIRWARADVKRLRAAGHLKKKAAKAWLGRIEPMPTLEAAVGPADYVQESGPERLEEKRAIFAALDAAARKRAVLASSTSAIDMTAIAEGLPGAARCIVAHPVNPPHVVPAVEVLGGRETMPAVVRKTVRFLRDLGQVPVLLNRFAPGFILNRMQAALIREAVDLVASGVADVQAVDDSIRAGLGLRWALLGPFGVANTNADGGVREYFTRFRDAYHTLWDDLRTEVRFDDALVARLGAATDRMLPASLPAQRAWRDALVAGITELKSQSPLPASARRRSKRTSTRT
ncbi:MAG: 3-hydroxyacyl-CoA dehydrogenase NAD-binding domain-containing protein [Gemmatimonadales bacterium]